MLVTASSAQAGTYVVHPCSSPFAGDFVLTNANQDALGASVSCPAAGGDSGVWVGVKVGGVRPAQDTVASWTLTAPAGTRFSELTVRRRLAKSSRSYELAVRDEANQWLDGCAQQTLCSEQAVTLTYTDISSASFGVRCMTNGCTTSTQNSPAWLRIEQADATLEDPAPPAVDAPVAPAGWQRTAPVTIGARDGSGIRSYALREGDRTVASGSGACDFSRLQPCPDLNTALSPDLADGVHTLTAVVTDAAGQSTTSAPTTLKLDRVAPAAPLAIAVARQGDDSFLYTWRNPDQGGAAPIVAAHLSDGTVVRGANLERLTAPSGNLSVWLEDEAGNATAANAASPTGAGTTVSAAILQPPILKTTAPSPKLKITKARRSKSRLTVSGTIAKGATAKVRATLKRGKRAVRGSGKAANGRWAITFRLTGTLRRKGINTLTVTYEDGAFAPATARKKISMR